MPSSPSTPRAEPADAALLTASREGSVEAFGHLVRRYQNLVCAIAYSRTGDRRLAEDVAQETFLAAWKQRDTIREPDRLRSWLCTTARNLSSKARRVGQREQLWMPRRSMGDPSNNPAPSTL